MTNALTIDVEDWFHPELVRDHLGSIVVEGRLPQAILPILNLLDRYEVKATFFILGDAAWRFPRLVRRIYEEGHEIGCHGMSHRMLGDLGKDGLEKELKDFRELMKKVLGDVEIMGFRAPTFSLAEKTKWALPILKDFGYLYDTSLFPARFFWNPLYGVEKAPRYPYRISLDDLLREDPDSPLWEFPAAIVRVGRFSFPVSGGFYLRSVPLWFSKWALRRINQEGPFHLYLHPWECDVKTPQVPLPLLPRLATYFGIQGMLSKLEGLLRTFSFSRMDGVLKGMGLKG